jgi:hypothetical protein
MESSCERTTALQSGKRQSPQLLDAKDTFSREVLSVQCSAVQLWTAVDSTSCAGGAAAPCELRKRLPNESPTSLRANSAAAQHPTTTRSWPKRRVAGLLHKTIPLPKLDSSLLSAAPRSPVSPMGTLLSRKTHTSQSQPRGYGWSSQPLRSLPRRRAAPADPPRPRHLQARHAGRATAYNIHSLSFVIMSAAHIMTHPRVARGAPGCRRFRSRPQGGRCPRSSARACPPLWTPWAPAHRDAGLCHVKAQTNVL